MSEPAGVPPVARRFRGAPLAAPAPSRAETVPVCVGKGGGGPRPPSSSPAGPDLSRAPRTPGGSQQEGGSAGKRLLPPSLPPHFPSIPLSLPLRGGAGHSPPGAEGSGRAMLRSRRGRAPRRGRLRCCSRRGGDGDGDDRGGAALGTAGPGSRPHTQGGGRRDGGMREGWREEGWREGGGRCSSSIIQRFPLSALSPPAACDRPAIPTGRAEPSRGGPGPGDLPTRGCHPHRHVPTHRVLSARPGVLRAAGGFPQIAEK